jgi:hypothetical protein
MRSALFDRVFLAPAAKDFRSWRPDNDNRCNSEWASEGPKISIAWWLLPCVAVWAVSVLVFS